MGGIGSGDHVELLVLSCEDEDKVVLMAGTGNMFTLQFLPCSVIA